MNLSTVRQCLLSVFVKCLFSVIVIKTLLKALVKFVGYLIFHHSQVRCEPFHWMYLNCLYLYDVPCCFYFVMRFSSKSTVVLLLSFFYNFSEGCTIFNIMHFYLWIIAVPSEGVRTPFVFARYFYFLSDPNILVFHTFVFGWKTSLENV
jgi:hypothetical protein